MNEMLEKAIELANTIHKGQYDRGGTDYIKHLEYVASGFDSVDEKIVAYLHDAIEDTDLTVDYLFSLGFEKFIVEAILAITKVKDESYFDYLLRVKNNELARKVKISDIKHNMNLSRLKSVSEEDIKRVEKYKNALRFLTSD